MGQTEYNMREAGRDRTNHLFNEAMNGGTARTSQPVATATNIPNNTILGNKYVPEKTMTDVQNDEYTGMLNQANRYGKMYNNNIPINGYDHRDFQKKIGDSQYLSGPRQDDLRFRLGNFEGPVQELQRPYPKSYRGS